jgi:hypothetical protein
VVAVVAHLPHLDMGGGVARRLDWPAITRHAADIVGSYGTSVTLRQLFYRLVSDGTLPNTVIAYKTLSDRTTRAREAGWFPDLIDRGRQIHRYRAFTGIAQAKAWLAGIYRRDHTEGQEWSLYLGVEKAGMVVQLQSWFGELGVPILALGGYSSHTYKDDVAADVYRSGRPAVLLYAGDHDPSGEDIDRDFVDKTACWAKVVRVALTAEQVVAYDLPPMPGKETDSRAAGFIARHGDLVQVELDALDPDDLRQLYQEAIDSFWDASAYQAALDQEDADLAAPGAGAVTGEQLGIPPALLDPAELHQAARAYCLLGWSVVPAAAATKRALVRWRQWQAQAPDLELVDRWWSRWPAANIAVITGRISGVVVIDLDVRHGAEASLAELEQQAGDLPWRAVVETPSGGWHVYVRHPGFPIPNSAAS